MAVSFPDGRPTLIVSWQEKVPFQELQGILNDHFKVLAHSLHTDCELRRLGSQQVLVTLKRTTREEELDMFVQDQESEKDEIETWQVGQEGEYQMSSENEDLSKKEICFEIPLENDVIQFLQDREVLLSEVIQKKFDCIATLCRNEKSQPVPATALSAEDSLSAGELTPVITSLPTGVRYLKILPGGFRIFVCLDDLTKHEVDAIVNTANEYLKHDHGLARALARTAGCEFEVESNNIVQQHGTVPVGSAVVTGAGCLPCKKVIHAVGPIWSKYPSSESDRLLAYAIRNSLVLANELQMTSIAIPAVSSGNGFPLQRCAELIVNTVKAFHGIWQPTDPLKEIRLVNFNESTARAIARACKNILGETEQKNLLSMDFEPNRMRDIFEFRNLHLEIKKENIEEQNTDVIVNTISRDLNLNLGGNSKAIAEKAGPDLQRELYRITKAKLIPFGEVLKTSGFQLSCEYVYHAVCSNSVSEKVLKKIICKCLEFAKEDNVRSIAFPATTDGKLSFPPNKMAKLLIEEVINFVECNENTRLANVYFVLHLTETKTYEAFLHELNRAKQLSEQGTMLPSINVQGEDDYLNRLPSNWGATHSSVLQKIPMDMARLEFQKIIQEFADAGLIIVKIERIQNPILWACHVLKKEMEQTILKTNSHISMLYQSVPAQFCNLVCRIGFQETYSQKHGKEYGGGIYFHSDVTQLIRGITNVAKIIHIFQAEVFTGNCTKGSPPHILPNLKDSDCYKFNDSTVDKVHPSKIYVIFTSVQAYPKYLITCRRG